MQTRKIIKILVLSGVAVSSVIIMAWLYDYGKPIGFEVTGITDTGARIPLQADLVEPNFVPTPLYSSAMQWRIFVNLAWQNVLTLTAILTPLAFLGGLGYKFYKHFIQKKGTKNDSDLGSKGSPHTSPPFWPYKFKFW